MMTATDHKPTMMATSVGNGRASPSPGFGRAQLKDLATIMASSIGELAPADDRVSSYIIFCAAMLRDYLKKKEGGLVQQTLLNNTTYVTRASNLAVETLCMASWSCFYIVFPSTGEFDPALSEKAILNHLAPIRSYITPDSEWRGGYYFISILRQAISTGPKYDDSKKIFGSEALYVGDFNAGDTPGGPTHRLYIVGTRVDGTNANQPLIGI